MITDLVDAAIDANAPHGSVEIVDALAAQLPCRVTAELLGFGADMWREVKSWSERQMRIDRRYVEPEVLADLEASIREWAAVMAEVLPRRAVEPADDLFSDWLAAGLDPNTMVQETGLLIAGGAETTRTVIAHGLRTFVDHPDQWERLASRTRPGDLGGRGADPLGHAPQQHVPHRHHRHDRGGHVDGRRRSRRPRVSGREP